ncbi:DNA translocase FtsK, partial [Candidatus Collierbacteria bacterium]|nr:DNA translocase FtsK [Candidatus Collierbacteria bacterium]
MARKKGRRSKPFALSLKKETVNSIFAILIIGLGGLISISFSRQGPILDRIYTTLSLLFGWTLILLPFLFVSGGLLLTKVKWGIAKPPVFLGSLISVLALTGISQAGSIGHQLFLSVASLITPAATYLFYAVGVIIGLLILFETSIEDISFALENLFKLLKRTKTKVNLSNMPALGSKQMKVKGLGEEAQVIQTKAKEGGKKEIIVNDLKAPVPGVIKAPAGGGGLTIWQPPPLSILSDEKQGKADRGDLNENAKTIEETLASFGIEAKVVEVNCGPAVTQYALQVALGTKLSKISALQSDLALALAAPQGQIRIEAPIPGRSLVGVEIPNRSLEFVSLKQMLTSETMQKNPNKTAVALGLDVSGQPTIADLSKMPHVLVAGATGSGKSVLINAFIASILFRASPDEVKFIMVDPKRVELTGYNGIPHLITPVIVEPEKVVFALNWALAEMEKRYKLFAEVGVRNIAGYNEISGFQSMHYIVIIIDELADIMLLARNEVENAITRLAQMARATGIHLVLATQRPSVDVITGLIKANIPCRIAFNVTSMVDSKVIIDGPGAEKLLGRGDMLYIPPDQAKPKRIQGAFVKDKEITDLINHLRRSGVEPEYNEAVVKPTSKKSTFGTDGADLGDVDEFFERAARFCVDADKASASLLQRHLSIGYARAARILDQLEKAGIVSAGEGSKPREVLINN